MMIFKNDGRLHHRLRLSVDRSHGPRIHARLDIFSYIADLHLLLLGPSIQIEAAGLNAGLNRIVTINTLKRLHNYIEIHPVQSPRLPPPRTCRVIGNRGQGNRAVPEASVRAA
jgi:hypothetical protein